MMGDMSSASRLPIPQQTSPGDWWQAARPHTWPNAFAPVVAGTGAAALQGGQTWAALPWRSRWPGR